MSQREEYELKKRFPGDFGLGDYCKYCGGNHKGECEEERSFTEAQEDEELQRQEFEWRQAEWKKKLSSL